ncbi:MAG: 4Fe-4S dicluster domain-containing protein [Planctomycetota bacterium]
MYLTADWKKCTGCRLCLSVCCLCHFDEANPKKAALAIDAKFPEPGTFHPRVCDQCGTCASVCPVEAISRNKDGVYIIDSEKCTGCGACVEACPLKVMFIHEDSIVPIKCDLCKECIPVCSTRVLSIKE